MDKLSDLVHQLNVELQSFTGDRFEGFLNVIGDVKNLQRTLSEISNGIAEDCGDPHAPRGMKKINHKEVISKGVRKGEKDLSSDYKGHIGMNGEEQPLKVMRKK
jgi:hypothetical protein